MTSRYGLFAVLSAVGVLAGCASGPAHPYEIRDGFDVTAARRVFLAPMNATIAIPAELEPGAALTFDAVKEHLEARGKTAVISSTSSFQKAWTAASRVSRSSLEG